MSDFHLAQQHCFATSSIQLRAIHATRKYNKPINNAEEGTRKNLIMYICWQRYPSEISEGITVWRCNVDVLVCHFLLNFSFYSDLRCCLNLSLTRQLVRNVYSLLTNVSLSKLGNIYSQREDKYIFSKRRKYIFQGTKKYKKTRKIYIFKRILFKKKLTFSY